MTNKPDEPELNEKQMCVVVAPKAVGEEGLPGGRPYLSYEGLAEQLSMDEAEIERDAQVLIDCGFVASTVLTPSPTRRWLGNV